MIHMINSSARSVCMGTSTCDTIFLAVKTISELLLFFKHGDVYSATGILFLT